jgi:hypothetical protein
MPYIIDKRDKEVHRRVAIIVNHPELNGPQRRDAHADDIGECGEVHGSTLPELDIASVGMGRRRQVEKSAYHEGFTRFFMVPMGSRFSEIE